MHDRTLARVTGDRDGRAVASMTLSAIRAVRLPCGAPIPTLEEVLEVCAAHELLVNVEVKYDVPSPARLAMSTARLVRASRWASHIVLSSFDPFIAAVLALLAPDVDRALLLEPDHRYLAPLARALRASAIHPAADLMTIANVERWHRWGMRVVPWTINDLGHAETLLSMGADGVITDAPASLRDPFVNSRKPPLTERRWGHAHWRWGYALYHNDAEDRFHGVTVRSL